MTTTDFYFAVASGYVLLPLAFAIGQKRGVKAAKEEMLAHKPAKKPVLTVTPPVHGYPSVLPSLTPAGCTETAPCLADFHLCA